MDVILKCCFLDLLFIRFLIFSFLMPLPLSNKDIDSNIFVLPEPFGPIKILQPEEKSS